MCSHEPDHLPQDAVERHCDEVLAGACVYHGLLRHAGRVEESYDVDGKIYLQRGKDLRRVTTWIGTGGYLAAVRSASFYEQVLDAARRDTGGTSLLPQSHGISADTRYVLPLDRQSGQRSSRRGREARCSQNSHVFLHRRL